MGDTDNLAPVLSYKKPSKKSKSPVALPALSDTSTFSNLPNQRLLLERRKALQEFYHLHAANPETKRTSTELSNANNQSGGDEKSAQEKENDVDSQQNEISLQARQLSDPEQLNKFVELLDIVQILKVRNFISNGLNQHELEKKSIIYDNYSELIKLSDVLADLNGERESKPTDFIDTDASPSVTSKHVNSVLSELSDFLTSEGPLFNQEFHKVIEDICNFADDSDSIASIKAISGD